MHYGWVARGVSRSSRGFGELFYTSPPSTVLNFPARQGVRLPALVNDRRRAGIEIDCWNILWGMATEGHHVFRDKFPSTLHSWVPQPLAPLVPQFDASCAVEARMKWEDEHPLGSTLINALTTIVHDGRAPPELAEVDPSFPDWPLTVVKNVRRLTPRRSVAPVVGANGNGYRLSTPQAPDTHSHGLRTPPLTASCSLGWDTAEPPPHAVPSSPLARAPTVRGTSPPSAFDGASTPASRGEPWDMTTPPMSTPSSPCPRANDTPDLGADAEQIPPLSLEGRRGCGDHMVTSPGDQQSTQDGSPQSATATRKRKRRHEGDGELPASPKRVRIGEETEDVASVSDSDANEGDEEEKDDGGNIDWDADTSIADSQNGEKERNDSDTETDDVDNAVQASRHRRPTHHRKTEPRGAVKQSKTIVGVSEAFVDPVFKLQGLPTRRTLLGACRLFLPALSALLNRAFRVRL